MQRQYILPYIVYTPPFPFHFIKFSYFDDWSGRDSLFYNNLHPFKGDREGKKYRKNVFS